MVLLEGRPARAGHFVTLFASRGEGLVRVPDEGDGEVVAAGEWAEAVDALDGAHGGGVEGGRPAAGGDLDVGWGAVAVDGEAGWRCGGLLPRADRCPGPSAR